jgi:hypothetical protein
VIVQDNMIKSDLNKCDRDTVADGEGMLLDWRACAVVAYSVRAEAALRISPLG